MSASRAYASPAAAPRPAPPPDPLERFRLPAVLFVLALALYAWRIWVPDQYVYDEVYHAYTAGQYVAGNADAYVWYTKASNPRVAYMWNHPPAGILLIALGIRLFGDDSFGWRIMSAVFGALGILIAYLMALDLTRRRSAALFFAAFLLTDSLYFVQSRTSMLDVFGVVFMTSALWGTWAWLRTPPARAFVPLVRIGLFLGLAVATKWNAVYASVLVGAVVIARTVRLAAARNVAPAEKDAAVRAHVAGITLGMLLLPALVYLAVYVPFFLTGHDFAQWIELQRQIYWYHSHLRETHTYQSKWWEWPLTLRPVWYSVTWASGRIAHVYANGNLFLYALFVPAVIATAIRRAKSDGAAVLVLLIGFFGQWLPWMLVPRIAFIYHFLPAAVFGSFALAWLASDLFERGGWPRRLALGYLALVAANFVYFYPIRAAVPLRPEAVEQRMWLKRWH